MLTQWCYWGPIADIPFWDWLHNQHGHGSHVCQRTFFSEKIFYHVLLKHYWSYQVEICIACCQCVSIACCGSVFSLQNQHLNGSQITKKALIFFTLQFSDIDFPMAIAAMKLKFSQYFTLIVLQQWLPFRNDRNGQILLVAIFGVLFVAAIR